MRDYHLRQKITRTNCRVITAIIGEGQEGHSIFYLVFFLSRYQKIDRHFLRSNMYTFEKHSLSHIACYDLIRNKKNKNDEKECVYVVFVRIYLIYCFIKCVYLLL